MLKNVLSRSHCPVGGWVGGGGGVWGAEGLGYRCHLERGKTGKSLQNKIKIRAHSKFDAGQRNKL
jgi:hypothetical protein